MKELNVPIINLQMTGANIKRLRKESGITVKEVQSVMGFNNPQAIYRWENGSSLPTLDNLVILSSILEVPIQEILAIDN